MIRGVLDGIAGRELRGRVFTLTGSAAPPVAVHDQDGPLGAAAVAADDGVPGRRPHEAGWRFSFTLPDALYDGRLRALRAVDEAHPDAFEHAELAFAGDPAILRPRPARPARRTEAAREDALIALTESVRAQTAALTRLLGGGGAEPAGAAPRLAGGAPRLTDRYGATFPDAVRPAARDVIWLGVIDWDFRIQRPQHLAARLADLHARVFYVSIVFDQADERGRFRLLRSPHAGVYELRLALTGTLPKNIYAGFGEDQTASVLAALDEAIDVLGIAEPTVVVQYPSWYPVACGIAGATVVHDCLDLVSGFEDTTPETIKLENRLLHDADLVVVSSKPLAEHVAPQRADTVLIRNAADVGFFASAPAAPLPRTGRPVIGYFGAIAYWYEIGWIEHAANAHPEWDFLLIGASDGCDMRGVQNLPNVRLLGERPYGELPALLGEMDVTVIPFKLTELITCTNPVKLYEYMAGGRPVVASAMPEVVDATDLVYIARDAEDFAAQIARALAEDGPELRERRRRWALEHNWHARADRMMDALATTRPSVSVVILAYEHWSFTRACLDSVLRFSDYANLEVIVVDNGSRDATPVMLRRIAAHDPRVKVVTNAENLGFAAGNNAGIAAARGDYVILLNNDTYVTRGWVRDLIRPLQQDPSIGLAGPLTNNMGNEQKVDLAYDGMLEMADVARRFVRRHTRRRFDVSTLAFFCVALRRDVIERVGLLDVAYGVGFYEDDDYCRRAERAGYRMVVVDDVFVHHHMSASFDALGAERKREQMERNKAIYEARWGPWRPHRYRNAPGFG
ncbi:MAG TPA: glycosyltransferase [Candidatus Elarobacter sp.]|nr:glycosyltransferase [Candidatus Elarobacter sp.]